MRSTLGGRLAGVGLSLVLVALTACAGNGATGVSPTTVGEEPPTVDGEGTEPETGTTAQVEGCAPASDGVPWRDDDSVTLEEIAATDRVTVHAARYPLPGPTDGLWSQWGQGIALGDGRHLSAVGDHLGIDANSYFFEYDSASRTLTRFADVLSSVPHEDGTFGYGKVHAPMVRDRCGLVWAATYWGTRDDLAYENGYEGDRLLAIDPDGKTITDHGAVAGEYGLPAMTITGDGLTIVIGSVDVESGDTDRGVLTVFDTAGAQTVEQVDDPQQEGFRALGIDPVGGGVMYSIGDGRLAALDPGSGGTTELDVDLPGYWLRAITRPAENGTVYGASDDEPVLFSIDAAGELEELGDPGGTTTSIAMTPDGSRIFWMPEAHGGAWEVGAPIMEMDTSTGEVTEVISLLDPFEEALDLLPGGTYSMVYDNGSLIVGVNASDLDDDSGFGEVVLVAVEGV